MFEYEQQRRPQKHEGGSRLITPPPAKRAIQTHRNDQVRFYILDKNERRTAELDIKYTGFVVPDEFVVGYGLDYAEKYRNLPYIAVLKEEVYKG